MVEYLEDNDDQMHCLDKDEPQFYIKKEDHNHFFTETSDMCKKYQDDYQRGYQNAIMEFQKQYNLRNRNVVVNKDKNKTSVDISPIDQNKKDPPSKKPQRKEDNRVDIMPNKSIIERKDTNSKDGEKAKSPFSLENEISKVNISVPFYELIKNAEYRN